MSILFDPICIGSMTLKNRFVRSATYDGAANRDGHVTKTQLALFSELAEGGVGLVITGITHVHQTGRISMFQNALDKDDAIPGLGQLTDTVHEKGAKIAVQLFHAGREKAKFFRPEKARSLAPSFIPDDPFFSESHDVMTASEIAQMIRAFGQAAKRAKAAGFDAVQIHGAHGYLFSQFLSPFTNRRRDKWGGSLENRLRFHGEVQKAIRENVGDDFPVLIKIGVEDCFPGGLSLEEGIRTAQLLSQAGFDALEISSGLRGEGYGNSEFQRNINSVEKEGYFGPWCREIRPLVDVPLMMVGGLRTPGLMAEVIKKGEADLVSLSRPLIREPGLINQWKKGRKRKSTCISCNKCFEALQKGNTLHCVHEKS